jgi:hypothetical protein
VSVAHDNRPDWMGFVLPALGLFLLIWWMIH